MGRVGAAGGNAAMESFFSLLQRNVLDRRRWDTRAQVRIAASGPVSFPMPVNWGSIADWAAAGGAVIASITALSIASRDRGERARPR